MSRPSTLLVYLLALLLLVTPAGRLLADDEAAKVRFFDSNQVKIAYTDEGRGPPVVYLHGMTGNREGHRALRKKLLAAGFRVIAIDARGHGMSDCPRDPKAYGPEMAHDFKRMLDHLKIDKAHVVGYSMGGDIANKIRELSPERLRTVVLGGVGRDVTKGWAANGWDNRELVASFQQGEGLKPLLRQPGAVRPGVLPEHEVEEWNEKLMKGQDARALAALMRAYPLLEVSEKSLRANDVPVLGIVGEDDPERPFAEQWLGVMRNFELTVVASRNHFTLREDPEFEKRIVAFLKKHSSE